MIGKSLLKDNAYVEFAYMTGVLPIAKYSSGSELNMFIEYDMTISERFSEYFGFLDTEVDHLHDVYLNTLKNPKVTREDLRIWYDGYYTAAGRRLYNPRSVVNALINNQIRNYWTSSGPYDEIFFYIRHNIEKIRGMRVLIDTNVLISAALSANGIPFQAYVKAATYPNHGLICEQNVDKMKHKSVM